MDLTALLLDREGRDGGLITPLCPSLVAAAGGGFCSSPDLCDDVFTGHFL